MSHARTFLLDSSLRSLWHGQGDKPCTSALNASCRLRNKTVALVVIEGTKHVRRFDLKGI